MTSLSPVYDQSMTSIRPVHTSKVEASAGWPPGCLLSVIVDAVDKATKLNPAPKKSIRWQMLRRERPPTKVFENRRPCTNERSSAASQSFLPRNLCSPYLRIALVLLKIQRKNGFSVATALMYFAMPDKGAHWQYELFNHLLSNFPRQFECCRGGSVSTLRFVAIKFV
jgi:hypothetical protein